MVWIDDLSQLACPTCQGALSFSGDLYSDRLDRGHLACLRCGAGWPVRDGLCHLFSEREVRGNDRLLRFIYDRIAPLHDPAVTYALPLLQGEGSEASLRDGYMRRLELGSLAPRPDGRPARILEVGIGCGANLSRVRRDLPPGLPVEIWGVDLSPGMLAVLRRRARRLGDRELRLLLADAHALPFPDGTFDRVFHVGGINGYRDPARALAEMARVAIPGTPVVVVDEQLDPLRRHGLYHRLMFRLVTFYDLAPHCPLEHVPEGATRVRAEQLSRFFYGLSFQAPARPARASAERRH